jgi:hypothetical protein
MVVDVPESHRRFVLRLSVVDDEVEDGVEMVHGLQHNPGYPGI